MVKKLFLGVLVVLILILGAVGVFVATFDIEAYRDRIEAQATETLNREVRLAGPMSLTVWPAVAVRIEQAQVANTDWGAAPHLLNADSLSLSVEAMPLLQNRLQINEIALSGVMLALEEQPDGTNNWSLGIDTGDGSGSRPDAGGSGAGSGLAIDLSKLRLRDVTLSHRAIQANGTPLIHEVAISRLDVTAPAGDRIRAEGEALFAGETISLSLNTGTLSDLMRAGDAIPLELRLEAAGATLGVNGTVALAGQDGPLLDVAMRFSGDRFADLSRLAVNQPPLPEGAPYSVTAQLEAGPQALALRNISAQFGESDLGGGIAVTLAQTPIQISAQLFSERFRPHDFTIPPASGGEVGGRATGGRAGEAPATGDGTLPWDALSGMDADIAFDLRSIETEAGPIGSAEGRINGAGGIWQAAPISGFLGGGALTANVEADGPRQRFEATVAADAVDYGALLDLLGITQLFSGSIDLDASLSGSGATMADVTRTLTGRMELLGSRGEVSTRYINDEWLQSLRDAAPFDIDLSSTVMTCLAAFAEIEDGQVRVEPSLIDTDQLTLVTLGNADLTTRTMDLVMRARPNRAPTAGLSAPLRVTGSFGTPSVTVDAAGAVGDVLSRFAGIGSGFNVPVVDETASGDANACVTALEAAGTDTSSGEGLAPAIQQTIEDTLGDSLPEGAGDTIRGLLQGLGR